MGFKCCRQSAGEHVIGRGGTCAEVLRSGGTQHGQAQNGGQRGQAQEPKEDGERETGLDLSDPAAQVGVETFLLSLKGRSARIGHDNSI